MDYYITYGVFQKHLTDYYKSTGKRMEFWEMMRYLRQNNMLSNKPVADRSPSRLMGELSVGEINDFVDSMQIMANSKSKDPQCVTENDMFLATTDVFIIRHPRYTKKLPHVHNYFEINYVLDGNATFYFEDRPQILKTGDFCFIAAGSRHALVIDDESTVFTIMLRRSTFCKTYFALLGNQDMLSHFFYGSLGKASECPNYMLFCCPPTKWLQNLILNAMVECYKFDTYSNVCCISMINELFAYLMRNHAQKVELFNYKIGSEFAPVMQYIQDHHRTLTLSALAEHFHYSSPYLCKLIKQSTGKNFSDLVKELRLTDATGYLINTSMKIHEIAERVGYNSADHFCRTFRAQYKMSPQAYRKQFAEENDAFFSFQTQQG